ncbi:MAG: GTPase ObgE [Candidatus Nealsonbacteria bacterium CG23_combo_of_CG06-09_8_20_14_all_40_13]|uniref:GTPase Obg n=1 Tax=Candidatus Nealsonbacteria bacterium CG23_combo_of_CG06-09_8_20_14_all_40_13 TaxID=1974724 RepID=A0A2G9YR50_9BACT|nr:MAG: GTPase ObgE [Candidatus Nealsonbacteria bacterium CG23_combo_of_CG06-09_8_20_14_all_40_13]PIR70999.1 MAG: GTPase ObgE [Candidatus Nealsonbacteria bacterium CG10_big_fil_rev_8_21_14_0_10_40_24]
MITDEVIISVKAGDGGNGLVSFRHEKGAPRGGPDGGDGGAGGEVYFVCDNNLNTLSEFSMRKNFWAAHGENGIKMRKTGKSAPDLVLKVPAGTLIYEIVKKNDKTHLQFIADMISAGEKKLIAKSGKGGLGNCHFATAVRQAPRFAQPGEKGEQKSLKIELKMLADIAIIGLPNCGKSTLLSKISNAHPKIANYPFTTLEPNLGLVKIKKLKIIAADIPGLIEQAHQGRGLGDKFLRHIERSRAIIHVLDATSEDLAKDYWQIRQELKLFSAKLTQKAEIVVINKIDKVKGLKIPTNLKKFNPLKISALTGEGINKLLERIYTLPALISYYTIKANESLR